MGGGKKRVKPTHLLGCVGKSVNTSQAFFIKDPLTNLNFLIDTGSTVSLLPFHLTNDFIHNTNSSLKAANGSHIKVHGHACRAISLNTPQTYEWTFKVADVKIAILGLDFLNHFGFLVDTRNKRLLTTDSMTSEIRHKLKIECAAISKNEKKHNIGPEFNFLLSEFPEVFELSNYHKTPKHDTVHHIITSGPPVHSRMRRLSPERMLILRRELQHLLDLDIIEPSNSPWASPVHMVPKGDTDRFRITGDYRLLNNQTQADRYPLPFLHDFADNLYGATIFSNLDLFKSYHQISIAKEDAAKTAIITPVGAFQFKKMAMGLSCAAQTFQRFLDEVLRGLPFVFCYVDDILIFSKDMEEHKNHLRAVFQRLNHFGLILNADKCEFGLSEIRFLGHMVSKDGLRPVESKIEAIRKFSQPQNMKQLRGFLGMLNFYRKFLPKCAELLKPLTSMLSPKKGSRKSLDWDDVSLQAFQNVKKHLNDVMLLSFPKANAKTTLVVDASATAIGATLEQTIDDEQKPLAFFSKCLSPAEVKYSTFDRELLAIYAAVRHFRYFVEGREFSILTDHKPLTTAFKAPLAHATARQTRHFSYISEFTKDIQYVKGTENVVADYLSRSEINAIFEGADNLNYLELANAQLHDESLNSLRGPTSSLKIEERRMPQYGISLLGDVSTGLFRPLVPLPFRRPVFEHLHALSHPGIKASQNLISQRFVWPQMKVDIRGWCRTCLSCQQTKIHRHTTTPLQHVPLPDQRFSHVHVDLVGPLPTSEGFRYLMTIVDRFTRWPEAIPLTDITAKTCADAFLLGWVSRFGAPTQITSDRGRQFTSVLWRDMSNFLGCKLNHTTAYHPMSNGLNERFNRSLKVAIKAQTDSHEWYSNLSMILLGLRATLKEDLHCSTAELTYGTTLRLPGQYFVEPDDDTPIISNYVTRLSTFMQTMRPVRPRHPTNRHSHVEEELFQCNHVFIRFDGVRTPLQRPYHGPYFVLDRNDKYFTLDIKGKPDTVSIDRLKAARILSTETSTTTDDSHHSTSTSEINEEENLMAELPNCSTEDLHPKPSEIDELPAGQYFNRRGRLIKPPRRYLD